MQNLERRWEAIGVERDKEKEKEREKREYKREREKCDNN